MMYLKGVNSINNIHLFNRVIYSFIGCIFFMFSFLINRNKKEYK